MLLRAKRDQSEKAIVDYFRKTGWSVLRISEPGAPDLCIGRMTKAGGICLLVEVKTGSAKLRALQKKFASEWLGHPPYVIRTVEEGEALTKAAAKL